MSTCSLGTAQVASGAGGSRGEVGVTESWEESGAGRREMGAGRAGKAGPGRCAEECGLDPKVNRNPGAGIQIHDQ